MNALVTDQIAANRASAAGWSEFADHRVRLTGLLTAHAGQGSLCVLGAGNCNDLDLGRLTAAFDTVRLVDLDGAALNAGVARQPATGDKLALHGGLDLTGAFSQMATWSGEVPHGAEAFLAAAPLASIRHLPSSGVVVSTCLLSQLVGALVEAVGEMHPRFVTLLQALRLGHLRQMLQLTAPGGVCLLVTDVVSSDTLPELDLVDNQALPGCLEHALRDRNFFHGTNPVVLAELFRSQPGIAEQVEHVVGVAPWRWNLGPRRYLVAAFLLKKAATTEGSGS
jgi:hypothetical protein